MDIQNINEFVGVFCGLKLKTVFSDPGVRDDMNNYISQYYSAGHSGEKEVCLMQRHKIDGKKRCE